MSRLRVRDLSASYGEINVLSGIELVIDAGETFALFGANGSGKSTLLRALSGLIARGGEAWLDGVSLNRLPAERIAAMGVAHVPQGRNIFAELSVHENLLLGGTRLSRPEVSGELDRIYALMPELAGRRRQTAGTLSGGERQMLAVGKALMMKPTLMLLDELSFGLAPRIVGRLFDALRVLREESAVSMLIVEQSPDLCADFASAALLLEGGAIAMQTTPRDPELKARLMRSHLAIA